MSNIIEKLGITPGPWVAVDKITEQKLSNIESIENENKHSYYPIVSSDDDRIDIYTTELNLILSAPEMLEALIDVLIDKERSRRTFNIGWNRKLDNQILSVEKATGKSWEEIKELTNA